MQDVDTNARQAHPRIPREFWEALIEIHNQLFLRAVSRHREAPLGNDIAPLRKAFQIMDCLLDAAIEEGWLD